MAMSDGAIARFQQPMTSATKRKWAAAGDDRIGLCAALATVAVALGNAHRRLLTVMLRLLGPRRAYALMGSLARRCYDAADVLRKSGEARCRESLRGLLTETEIEALSRAAFVHRIWNLADLILAPRLLRGETWDRYGGRIPESLRSLLLDAQQRRQPVILVTTYCGPYDLLPVFLGLNGIRVTAVYRPHPNRQYDRYRQSVRASTGCQMVTDAGAAMGLSQALADGRTVALLSDPTEARSGIPISFLGVLARVPRTVALLAEHYGAIVAVAAIRRRFESFQFELVISDFFGPRDWCRQLDVAGYCTRRYCAALEKLILEAPEQFLWLRSSILAQGKPSSGEAGRKAARQVVPT